VARSGACQSVPFEGTFTLAQLFERVCAGVLAGEVPFDVALVRAYCERLVAEGERLAMERVVFADWTRARGAGPENRERAVFTDDVGRRGGWPGPLAREYGWERCKVCRPGFLLSEASPDDPAPIEVVTGQDGLLRCRCSACKGRGRTRKPGVPPGFASGDSIARTARRLLDTLDGQCPWAPSAGAQTSRCACWSVRPAPPPGPFDGPVCPPEDGQRLGYFRELPRGPDPECRHCRGTGHNLAGVLPEVEHPGPRVSARYASASRAMASAIAVASFDIPRAVALARAGGLSEPLAPPPVFGPFPGGDHG
jgi:hypothetical protein